ncbi:MAG: 23S rRNA (adenine(2503)-C(2))-methyltransferase RlmN [Myxococcales bacterium]|nr:23S rRNA (adenine(2503)-C(2))-methyltransferase RlmN [Myxococcales bacterium]
MRSTSQFPALTVLPSHSSSINIDQKVDLLGLPFAQLEAQLDSWGVGKAQAKRVFRGLHVQQIPLHDINSLGRHADTIAELGHIAQARLLTAVKSPDGTEKLLLEMYDGAQIEAVLLPMRRDRYTLCVSTQVGCGMACTFCATGTLGLKRTLSSGEVVAQVYQAHQYIKAKEGNARSLSHLVFMGMGEPLHRYERTRDALQVLLGQHGLCFSARQVTVSTVGLVPAMRKFSEDFQGRVQLALSLHAGTDATRQKIMPVAKKWTLAKLKQALLDHPLPGRRVLMLEYVVLPGLNDTPEELDGVAEFQKGLRALVNLIPFNPFKNSPFRSPTEAEVLAVDQGLKARGVASSIRVTRGRDKSGACGQLAIEGFNADRQAQGLNES